MIMKPLILIVDDDPGIRKALEEALAGEGYRTVSAGTGAEAIDILHEDVPQLVFLDLMLVDMSGVQILGVIKEKFPRLPVVILTAYRETDTAVLAMKLNAFDYLNKPIQLDRLLKVARKALPDSFSGGSSGTSSDESMGPTSTLQPESWASSGASGAAYPGSIRRRWESRSSSPCTPMDW